MSGRVGRLDRECREKDDTFASLSARSRERALAFRDFRAVFVPFVVQGSPGLSTKNGAARVKRPAGSVQGGILGLEAHAANRLLELESSISRFSSPICLSPRLWYNGPRSARRTRWGDTTVSLR